MYRRSLHNILPASVLLAVLLPSLLSFLLAKSNSIPSDYGYWVRAPLCSDGY
jgi:hypothetical protein